MRAETLRLPYRIEPMAVGDLDAIMEIEGQAHASPWPAAAYRHELEENTLSHYYVLVPKNTPPPPNGWWQRLIKWFRPSPAPRTILGYGGFWIMVDEAHISTIAVDPERRGRGLGELILISLIEAALKLDATLVTLEVRVSNSTAQSLYQKYQMEIVGQRKRYYRNNQEDAHIMTVGNIQSPAYRAFLDERWRRLRERLVAQEPTQLELSGHYGAKRD